jgi:hypothetical protein
MIAKPKSPFLIIAFSPQIAKWVILPALETQFASVVTGVVRRRGKNLGKNVEKNDLLDLIQL